MVSNLVHLNKALKLGDRFIVCSKDKYATFMVMAVEYQPKGQTNKYWVLPVLETK